MVKEDTNKSGSARYSALVKASLIAIGADLFLIILKAVLAAITGSAVIQADAWHSGGDFAVSFTVLISIIINHKFKDNVWARNAEGLVALFISFILIFGSMKVIFGVFGKESTGFFLQTGIPLVIAIFGISIACAVAFEMFRFKRRMGKEHSSIAFLAESDHTRSDYFTSFGVLLTLVIGYFGIHIERLTTLFVGIMVLRVGFLLLFKALRYFNLYAAVSIKTEQLLPERISQPWSKLRNNWKNILMSVKKSTSRIGFFKEEWIVGHRRSIAWFMLILILALYLGTGFYSVLPYQTGVELLFGKVMELNPPGAHYHPPKPFGNVIRVDTEVTARVESGYRTVWDFQGREPEVYLWEYTHTRGRYIRIPEESIAITGDENLVDVNVLCYYRIVDPVQYALNNENAHELLRNLFCYVVHSTLGQYHIDSLLTTGRRKVQNHLFRDLKDLTNDIPLGVEILRIYLQETHPPLEVVPQYRAVASARERKNEIIHQANAYYQDFIPRSRGKAKAEILLARAFAEENVQIARGEAESFLLRQGLFRKYSSVQQDRLWWDTVEKVFSDKPVHILPGDARRRIYTSDLKLGVDQE